MKIPEIVAKIRNAIKMKHGFTDDQVIAYLKGAEDALNDNGEALEKRDAMLRDTVAQLAEAKRLLKLAVEDIGKIAAVDECVYPHCDDSCPFIAVDNDCCDVKQWKHYDEAMKLIDAEEFENLFENQIALGSDPYHAAMDALQDATAVDTEPVRHSKWVAVGKPYRVHDVMLQNYKCRDCKESMATRPDNLTNYCPNCGAKMYGGAENGNRKEM